MEKPKAIKLFFLPGWGGGALDAENFFSHFPSWIQGEVLYSAPVSQKFPQAQNAEALAHALVEKIKAQESPFLLCGYSMGARIAALMAQCFHSLPSFRGLILLSGGLGMRSPAEQAERRAHDAKWQELLISDSKAFWAKWYEQPLFQSLAGLAEEKKRIWDRVRGELNSQALANDMGRYGAGAHPYLLPLLAEQSRQPLLYLYGEKDLKYTEIAQIVKSSITRATVLHIPGAGHILPLEAPSATAKAIESWIINKI